MAQLGDLTIRLLLDVVQADKTSKQYTASLKTAEAETQKLAAQSVTLSEKVQNIGLRMMGFQSVVNVLKSSIGGLTADYQAQEVALAKLGNGLKNVGEGQGSINKLSRQAGDLQKITPFSDEEINNAQAMLTTFQKNSEQIEILTPRMLDLAAAYMKSGESGMDLQQVAVLLGKVNEESIGGLRRVGVAFSKEQEEKLKSLKGTEQAIYLSTILDSNFKDMAKTVGETSAGQMKIFDNQVGELRESLGKILQEGILPVLNFFRPLVEYLANASEPVKRLTLGVMALGVAFVVLGTSMGGLPFIIGGIITLIYALGAASQSTEAKMREMGNQSLKTGEVSKGLKKILDELKTSANNTAEAYDRISESLYGMSKAQLENAKASIEAELIRVRGQQLDIVANPSDDWNERLAEQAPVQANISKLQSLLAEINTRISFVKNSSTTSTSNNTGTSSTARLKEGKELLSLLVELQNQLDEIDKKIAIQSKGESDVEGLFIKKKEIENEIELIKAVNTEFKEYKNIRDSVVGTVKDDSNKKPMFELIPMDDLMRIRIEMQDWLKKSEESEKFYQKIVSDLDAAANIASLLSQRLEGGGKGLFYWFNAALQIARQIMSIMKAGKSKEGIGFGDILGFVGTVLPFFLAGGGSVPGSGSGDTVPAMLTPGEFVINKSAVSRLGANMLNWLNGGGAVSQKSVALPGMGSMVIINMNGELTDHLRHDIVSKGNVIVNVRKKNSSY